MYVYVNPACNRITSIESIVILDAPNLEDLVLCMDFFV